MGSCYSIDIASHYVLELSYHSDYILLICYMFIGLVFWGVGRSYCRSFPTEPWLCLPLFHPPFQLQVFRREQLEVGPWSVLVPRESFISGVVDALSLYVPLCYYCLYYL